MSNNSKASQLARQASGKPSLRQQSGARPRYETPEDLAAETAYAQVLAHHLDCDLAKLSDRHRIDYAAFSKHHLICGAPKLLALVEIKCRYYPVYSEFASIMVHAEKLMHGLWMGEQMQVGFIIAQREIHPEGGGIDYLCFADSLPPGSVDYAYSGRVDTEDPDDLGIRAYIPKQHWHVIKRW